MTFAQGRNGPDRGQVGPGAPRPDSRPGALLDAITRAATEAADYIRARAGDLGAIEWQVKSPADFVSDVDTGAEARIRRFFTDGPSPLAPAWPADTAVRIVGEEGSPDLRAEGAGVTLVVDPLDGTTNFLHGYPWYAVSIGALVDGVLTAGVVLNVATGECFTAAAGHGAWRDGVPIRVSTITEPARALLGTGLPFKYAEHIEPFMRPLPAILRATAGVRRAGSAALDLADVACGRFDAFWELGLAPWDVAAGLLLIREAGGVVTDLDGRPAVVEQGAIVAGSPAMHRWLLDMLRA